MSVGLPGAPDSAQECGSALFCAVEPNVGGTARDQAPASLEGRGRYVHVGLVNV